ncbi:MAG: DUF6986 family protein [Actinomycetes bacterium]
MTLPRAPERGEAEAVDLDDLVAELDHHLAATDAFLARRRATETAGRQPVHTVYVPAYRASAGVVPEWGALARQVLEEHAPEPDTLLDLLDLDAMRPPVARGPRPTDLGAQVHARVLAKLDREPVEDLRVDFEDGYGTRPDDEEDAAAGEAAAALARARDDQVLGPACGVRVKSLEQTARPRALRTLDLVLGGLADRGGLPAGFVVTWPKVSDVAQVEAAAHVCEGMERRHGLPAGALRFEAQIETPPAVLGADGSATVARLVHVGDGRLTGLHFGTYDYGAALGVPPAWQGSDHPVADFAKSVLQVVTAGTGVRVADGSTNVLPVGERAEVHAAWRLHARLVRRALAGGLVQGWDMHPGHLVTRYAATYAFYREGLADAVARLSAYVDRRESGVLDEPATAVALAGFLLRGLDCGAVDEDETGPLDRATLATLAQR